jgi:hypothetical protein
MLKFFLYRNFPVFSDVSARWLWNWGLSSMRNSVSTIGQVIPEDTFLHSESLSSHLCSRRKSVSCWPKRFFSSQKSESFGLLPSMFQRWELFWGTDTCIGSSSKGKFLLHDYRTSKITMEYLRHSDRTLYARYLSSLLWSNKDSHIIIITHWVKENRLVFSFSLNLSKR